MRLRSFSFLLLFLTGAFTMKAQTIHPDYEDGKIFVKTYNSISREIPNWDLNQPLEVLSEFPTLTALVQEFGISLIEKPFKTPDETLQHIWEFQFGAKDQVESLIQRLEDLPEIEYAEKIPIMRMHYNPNDDNFLQWHLNTIQAFDAWDLTRGNSNVLVAIVDDAVRLDHEDLAPRIYTNPGEIPGNGIDDDNNGFIDDVNGWDAADDDNDPNPPAGATNGTFTHGTHVAGIAAAATDNGKGIASIGFNVSILPCKSKLDTTIGSIQLDNTYRALDYAIIMGADVANMSFGGSFSLTFSSLCNAAYYAGVVLVASAGNDGQQITKYPAGYSHVISVGSTSLGDTKSGFSNWHQTVDVMAPGSQIYSTLAGGTSEYGFSSGTSMSAPVVTGLIGLMLSLDSTQTVDEVEACLKAGCDNIDSQNSNYVGFMGAGRVNAYRSLDCILNPVAVSNEAGGPEFHSPFPNPSVGAFSLSGFLPDPGKLEISVSDIMGNELRTLFAGQVPAGNFSEQFEVALPAGIYLIQSRFNGQVSVQKLQVLN